MICLHYKNATWWLAGCGFTRLVSHRQRGGRVRLRILTPVKKMKMATRCIRVPMNSRSLFSKSVADRLCSWESTVGGTRIMRMRLERAI